MITKNEIRDRIHNFDNESLISKYQRLRNFMFQNPGFTKEGDLVVLNLIRFELKNRGFIIE